jgi:methylated-DNA-protein-cysteine methyltransferase-like protein
MSGTGRFFEDVYALVAGIPRGRVATYGQVAALLGVTRGARAVGWALRVLDEERARRLPWHRVVGSGGRISLRAGAGPQIQRRRLRAEGVAFRAGCVDLSRHGLLAEAEDPARADRRARRPGAKGKRPAPPGRPTRKRGRAPG